MKRCLILLFTVFSIYAHAQNLLRNGDFRLGNTHWQHLANNGAQATYALTTGPLVSDSALEANIQQMGANAWDAQSIHSDYICQTGKRYEVSVWAKGATAGNRFRLVMQDTSYLSTDVTISTNWVNHRWNFTASENGLNFKIHWITAGRFQISRLEVKELSPITVPVFPDSLQYYASRLGLTIGAALEPLTLGADMAYRTLFTQQFNGLVAENAMKMANISPARGVYNFQLADSLVKFGLVKGKKVRGHTLLWHSSIPAWFSGGNYPADTIRKILKDYTYTVVGHFRGKIDEWDVVNEALTDQAPHGLRSNFIYSALGTAIIDSMFRWAHDADPQAKLFYNDYSIEFSGGKATAMLSLVNALKNRGVPIAGVGFQSHFDHNVTPVFLASVESMVQRVANLGLKVSFTEVDLGIRTPITPPDYVTQARTYAGLMRIALRNANAVKSFYLWGFTDRYSWIPSFWASQGTPKDDALILDRAYNAKPAYDSLLSVLKQQVLVTSIHPQASNEMLRLWPNPSSGQLFVQGLPPEAAIQVFDYHGRNVTHLVSIDSTGPMVVVNTANLRPGVYILKSGGVKRFVRE